MKFAGRNLRLSVSVLAVIVLSVGMNLEASGAAPSAVVVSTMEIPLVGLGGSDSPVVVHVVTRVLVPEGGGPATIAVNAALSSSAQPGRSGGTPRILAGAAQHIDDHDISNGEIIPCVLPGFKGIDTGAGVPPTTFNILLDLQFSPSGGLVGGTATVAAS